MRRFTLSTLGGWRLDHAAENTDRPTSTQRIGVVDEVAARQRGSDQRQQLRHSRLLIFQLSEVSVPRRLFQGVLDRIGRLSPAPS